MKKVWIHSEVQRRLGAFTSPSVTCPSEEAARLRLPQPFLPYSAAPHRPLGVEPNPDMSKFDLHTFDTQPTAVIEIYSSDDPPQWILSYTAPQTMEDLFECLAEEDHLARWPPPSGKEWNTLQSAGGVQVAWGHSVEAGKYKIVARRPRPAASFTTPARSRPSPSPPPSPSAEQSTPLRVDGRGTSGAAVIVLQDSSTTYPASTAYFNALDTGTQEAIRTGNSRSEEAIWDFVSQVYGEWSSFFVPEAANRAVVTTANRKYVAGQAFRCITSSRRTQSGRLLAGVRGIGKSQLLVLLCIASQIAFGTTLLAIYHDFAQNGKGKARHSLASILRLAIITRWPDSEDKIDDLLAAETGSDIHRCVSICAALGKAHNHNQVPVTMALFADEVQNLFAGQRPSQRLVSELKTAALATGLATFLSGIAYSLQDGLSKENFDLGDKMRTVRLLPITTREELQAVRNLWHEDWRTTDDLPAGTTDQQLELDRRIFLHTGGVLRNMFYYSTADQFRESIKEPPADSKALAVLAFLYSTNRTTLIDRGATEFDPFQQAAVPITEVCNMTDTRWDEAVVHKLADDGWLLLDGDGHDMKVMFLRPAHYSLMERRHQNLTLLERAAIRFPEGRTLGEQWEVFYAEHLVERRALQWFDTAKPRHLELFQHMRKHNEQYFRDHQLKLFKPSPDTIGYDLLWWRITAAPTSAAAGVKRTAAGSRRRPATDILEMHFIQVKVGAKHRYVTGDQLAVSIRFAKAAHEAEEWMDTDSVPRGKMYRLEPVYELVSSRRLGPEAAQDVRDNRIGHIPATDHTYWGVRVFAYCSNSVPPVSLFE